MRRRALLSTALTASAALGLAACGKGGSVAGGSASPSSGASSASAASGGGAIDAISVSGQVGVKPEVTFSAPLTVKGSESKIVTKGSGEAIVQGDSVGLHTVYINAQDGSVLQSSWEGGPSSFLAVDAQSNGADTAAFLTTATVGSRFAMLGQVRSGGGQTYSVVQVSDIVSKALRQAQGTAVPVPADQPQFTLGSDGAPKLSGTPSTPAPSTTTATVTIEGTGEKTANGQALAMHYTGWKLSDGSQFDSSWDRGAPFSFTLGQGEVIKGWDAGLVGRVVGSQVLLVIPPAEAYGTDPAQHELGGETLIFVADILGAVAPPAA